MSKSKQWVRLPGIGTFIVFFLSVIVICIWHSERLSSDLIDAVVYCQTRRVAELLAQGVNPNVRRYQKDGSKLFILTAWWNRIFSHSHNAPYGDPVRWNTQV